MGGILYVNGRRQRERPERQLQPRWRPERQHKRCQERVQQKFLVRLPQISSFFRSTIVGRKFVLKVVESIRPAFFRSHQAVLICRYIFCYPELLSPRIFV